MNLATAQDWEKLDKKYPAVARGRRHFLAEYNEGAQERAVPALKRMAKAMYETFNDPKTHMMAKDETPQSLRAALVEATIMAMMLLERIKIHEGHADALLFEIGAPDWPDDYLVGVEAAAQQDFASIDKTTIH